MRKVIEKHPNYCVTEDGVVYRMLCFGLYSPLTPDLSNGYARVDLDGTKEYIAKLVLEAFDPPKDLSYRVFYIDGNKMNYSLSNLTWLTPSDIERYSEYTIERRKELFERK